MDLVLGVDAGGTASKAVVSDLSGVVRGRGAAGPGNPSATGTAAATAVGSAVRSALGAFDPGSVVAGVVGLAGVSAIADPGVAAAFDRSWASLGLTCEITLVGDAVTAFAAGGPWSSGAVLVSGTGAVAALVDGLSVVRAADGLGWLLGDEGSGMWLGLQAVRSAARSWAGGGALVATVAGHAGVASADDLVHWAGRLPFGAFASLAPAVCALADSGDPTALRLVASAADRLMATLDELSAPSAPVVLAGSLLTNDTPVRRGVLSRLADRGIEPGTATDPVLGAVRLASYRVRA
ncbi:BadF/BadG/BcrA/BcrD ATPase family protein [Dactylosporangium sp. AC04546]|uniref:N-acetylglucosamine kinase n=1 Tax=Dactylosporangium sp. AC04546 TaxID=2862460 RepID=UPI001EDE52CF|nr:BadF/BadG/BcrA/BcrD ATPase family protein [Dactylosporangium sp. AC04546]WVK84997.1 BadF/BadG/BcrA/BcrD ATPase family protein [Dactylosporangium sp. AC04546]